MQTIFFDEAHGLKESGLDALLKATEEPVEGVCILFATTKPWPLSKTLKSRLFEVHVKALSQSDSMTLLRRIVAKAQLTADTDALLLLASLKRGHPRDLISGLEQVSLSADHITADAVKRCFDIDQEDYLTGYLSALSTADTSAQCRIIREWKEPLAAKIRWIRAYLLSMYYRDLLRHDVMVDPVVDTMRRLRSDIVRSLCERLQLDDPSALAPYWRRLLNFWFVPSSTDETLLRLRLTLFEDMVNRGITDEAVDELFSPTALLPSNISNTIDHPTQVSWASAHAPGDDHPSDGKYWFGSQDLALIVNRASFFAQHHGRYMNASFEVTPAFAFMRDDATAMAVITRFAQDLDRHVGSTGEASAIITVFDKGITGVIGRILAYVPDLARGEGGAAALEAWCHQWTFDGKKGHYIKLVAAPRKSTLRFHWRAMASFAARMHDATKSALARHFIEALKVKHDESYIGPLPGPPVSFSGALIERAIDRACQFQMPLLSAVDDGAFDWLTNGWELVEYQERTSERLAREHAIRQVDETYEDSNERAAARALLENEWPKSAKSRPRKSTRWWWRGDD